MNTVEVKVVATGSEEALRGMRIVATGSEELAKKLKETGAVGSGMGRIVASGAKDAGGAMEALHAKVKTVQAAFAEGQGGASLFALALQASSNPILQMATASGVAALAVHKMTASLMENASAVRALQNVSGLGVEAASALNNAMTLMGKESEAVRNGLFKMAAEIDAGGGSIARLGVALRDSQGNLKNEGQLFVEVRDKLSQIGDVSTRNAIAMAIFGRGARELSGVMAKSREDFQALLDKGQKLNPVTAEMTSLTKKLSEAQHEGEVAWQGLTNAIALGTLPNQIAYNKSLNEAIGLLRKLMDAEADLNRQRAAAANAPARDAGAATALGRLLGTRPSSSMTGREADLAAAQHAAEMTSLPPTGASQSFLKADMQAQQIVIKATEQKILESIAIREAALKDSLARSLVGEQAANQQEILFAQQRAAAEIKAIDDVTAVIKKNAPGLGATNPEIDNQVKEQEMRRAAVVAKSAIEIQALKTRAFQIELAELKQISDMHAEQAALFVTSEQAGVDAAKSAALERIQIMGSAEAAFVAQTKSEAQARVAALGEEVLATQQGADAAVAIMDNANTKIQNMFLDLATGGASTIQRQWDNAVTVIDAAVKAGDLKFEEGEAAKFRIAQAGILARSALVESDIQRLAELYAMNATNFNSAENQKLRAEAANVDAIAAKRQTLVDAQVKVNVERLAGINKAASDELAIVAGTVNSVIAARQREIDNLNAVSSAQERFNQQALEGLAAQQRAVGDFAGFFATEFTRALTAGNDAWSNLAHLAADTAQAMQRGFSDLFFDVLSDKFNNLKELGQNVLDSMKRALADFLSSQLMRQIGETLASAFGVNFGAGGAALAASANAAAVALVGLAQAAAQAAVAQGSTSSQIASLASGTNGGGGTNGMPGLPGIGSVASSFLSNLQANWSAGQGLTGGLSNVFFGQAPSGVFGGGPDLGTAATSGIFGSAGSQSFFSSTPGFGTAGAMGNFVAGVGVAMNLYSAFSNLGSANSTGTLAGTVAGGIIGAFTPLGPILGASLGGWLGGILGDLFGSGPSENWLKFGGNLKGTLTGEQQSVQTLQSSLVASKNLTDLAASVEKFRKDIEAAGAGGFFAATAGQGLFAVPGIPGATGTAHEGGILADFAPQINELNDVIGKVLDAFRQKLGTELPGEIEKLLPVDLFKAFVSGPLADLQRQFDELTTSGSATVDQLKSFEAEIQAVSQIAIIYAQVNQQIASLSGDLAAMTAGAKDAARMALDAANKAVQDSRSRLAEAISGPEIVAAGQELQKAILDRYALERKLVEDIEKNISDLLAGAGNAFLQTAGVVATIALQSGDSAPLETLRAGLDALGQTSNSTALRLWAVNASLQALVAAVPIAIRTGTLQTPGQITSTIGAGAGPSIAALGGLYGQATAAGDLQGALGILGQASTLIQGLAAAAVAGVQQWAAQATTAAQSAGQRIITQIQTEAAEKVRAAQLSGKAYIEAAQKAGEGYIKAIQDEAKAKADANSAAIAGLNEQKTALQANLATSREWARVADSLRGFITQLELGPQAPPDPMGQFQLAKTLFDAAVAAAPTSPEAAGKVQQSAADLLAAAQLIYTRPSPEYAQLFDEVKAKLESVQATAARFVTPEEQAVAQLESIDVRIQALNESSRAIQESAQQQIQAVNDGVKAEVDRINAGVTAYVDSVNATSASQIQAINDGVKAHIDAINAQAQTEIDEINAGLSATMSAIAAEQAGLLGQLIGAQVELLNSITGDRNVANYSAMKQGEAVEELKLLNANVAAFLATGIPHAAGGLDRTREGLHYLHDDEAVLKPSDAASWRAGRYNMPTTTVASPSSRSSSEVAAPITLEVNITINGATDVEKVKKEVVKAIEESVRTGPLGEMVRSRVGYDPYRHR